MADGPIVPAVYRGEVTDAEQRPIGTVQIATMQRTDSSFVVFITSSTPAAPGGGAYGWFSGGESISILSISAAEDTTIWRSSSAGSELEGTWEVVGGPSIGDTGSWTARLALGHALVVPGQSGQFIPPPPSPGAWLMFALFLGCGIALALWVRRTPAIDTPAPVSPGEIELSGVGGWMMLFLIGQGLAAVMGLVGLSTLSVDLASWPLGDVVPAFKPLFAMETAAHLVQLVLAPLGIVLTAKMWRGTPRYWFAYLGLFLLYAILDLIAVRDLHLQMGAFYGPTVQAEVQSGMGEAVAQHWRTMLFAPIWMTYWAQSRRVRWTFGAGALGGRPEPLGGVRIAVRSGATSSAEPRQDPVTPDVGGRSGAE